MALNSLFCADVPLSNYSLTIVHAAPVTCSRRCVDFVKLYVDLERPEVAERAEPGFTVCGRRSSLAQTKFYSSQRSLILEFHSDTAPTNNTGFRGIYRFLNKSQYIARLVLKNFENCTMSLQVAVV